MGVDRTLLFRLATSERFEKAAKAAPGGQTASWRAASRYVAGRSRTEALGTAAGLLERGHGVSVDLFGELVSDPARRSGGRGLPVAGGVAAGGASGRVAVAGSDAHGPGRRPAQCR